MTRTMTRLIVGFFLCGIHAIAAGQPAVVQSIEIIEAGIYEARVVGKQSSGGTAVQVVNAPTLVESTTKVPAKVGTRFGFRFVVNGSPMGTPVSLTLVTKFPPPGILNAKTGSFSSNSEIDMRAPIGRMWYTDYSIDDETELVAGRWVFELFYRGRKLAEYQFTVVPE